MTNKYKNKQIELVHQYFKEVVYQAANLENKNITYSDTLNTIDFFEEATKTIPYEKIVIITSLKKAYEYVIERANSDEPITYKDAMKINELIDSYERRDAGFFRNSKVMISGTTYIPPLFSEQQSITILERFKTIETFEDGVRLCAYWSKNQLFTNGNKRTFLCFANLCLLAKGLKFILIGDRVKYSNALVDYYEDDKKLEDFVNYIQESSKNLDEVNYKQYFGTIDNLTKSEQLVINLLINNKGITTKNIALLLDYSERQIMRIIKQLESKGNIKRVGSRKTGYWEILVKPKTI